MVRSGRALLFSLGIAGALLLAALPPAAAQAGSEGPEAQRVYDLVDTISDWYRYLASPEHEEAADYIEDYLRGLELDDVYRQEFTVNQAGQPLATSNVVGYLEGKDPDTWLVLGGHYDATVGSDAAAYDNAVGTATVLELARFFTMVAKERQPEISLVFGAWDAEEEGGRGSARFVELIPDNVTVAANLNFDMFGLSYPVANRAPLCDETYFKLYVYTSPVSDFSAYDDYEYDNETLANFTTFRDRVENVSYEQLDLPPAWVPVIDDTEANSDQRSFIRAGIPAAWFRGMHENAWEEGDSCEQTIKHFSTDRLESLEAIAGSQAELLSGFQTGLDIAAGLVEVLAFRPPEPAIEEPADDDGKEESFFTKLGQGPSGWGAREAIGLAALITLMAVAVGGGYRLWSGSGRAGPGPEMEHRGGSGPRGPKE